jgi:hypothetical protein
VPPADRKPATRFTVEEILHVARSIMNSSEAILIGGQSLNLWAETYKSRQGELGALAPFESKDIDFLGTVKDVQACARALGGRARYPSLYDATPEVGVIDIDLHGKPLQINFLGSVAGLRNSEIRKAAVRIRFHDVEIRVLHPLNLLQSRLINVCGAVGRTDPLAFRQMRAAILVAAAYIDEAARHDEKLARRLIEALFSIGTSREALKLWYEHEIDIGDAIREYPGLHPTFVARRLPQMRRTLETRRMKYKRVRGNEPGRTRPL